MYLTSALTSYLFAHYTFAMLLKEQVYESLKQHKCNLFNLCDKINKQKLTLPKHVKWKTKASAYASRFKPIKQNDKSMNFK